MRTYAYRAFGLQIRSSAPIAGLVPQPEQVEHTLLALDARPLTVVFGSSPHISAEPRVVHADADLSDTSSLVVSALGDAYYRYQFGDGVAFTLAADGSGVWATWEGPSTLDDVVIYLLGTIMAAVLRLRGILCLHAGLVEVDGSAIAIIGPSTSGKSTTTAALALAGANVLSDDVAPVFTQDGMFHVHAAYPRVRLWEDSTRFLFGDPDALPRLTPTWEKRYFESGAPVAATSWPLRAMYFLEAREVSNAPRLEPMTQRDVFISLLANMHSLETIPSLPQVDAFTLATQLAAYLPAQRVVPHTDPACLPELCALISGAAGYGAAAGTRTR